MRRRNEDRQLSSYILIIFDIETIWKVVCNQLFEYFTNNKLFYNSQYGFRTAHSTAFAISELSDRVSYDIDNKKNTSCHIYGASQDVWDAGSHNFDYKIMESRERLFIFKWVINYLSDRTQFVAINDICSSSKVIQMGVPQGLILGPLLFLIYMNDIPNSSRHLDFILYADDTTLRYNWVFHT